MATVTSVGSRSVKRDGLGDPRAGVERYQGQRPVTRRGACLHGSQLADLGSLVERVRRGGGNLNPLCIGRPESAPDVEVIDGGQAAVDGCMLALEHK